MTFTNQYQYQYQSRVRKIQLVCSIAELLFAAFFVGAAFAFGLEGTGFEALVSFGSFCLIAAIAGLVSFGVRRRARWAMSAAVTCAVLDLLVAVCGLVLASASSILVWFACRNRENCQVFSTATLLVVQWLFVVFACVSFGVSVRVAHTTNRLATTATIIAVNSPDLESQQVALLNNNTPGN